MWGCSPGGSPGGPKRACCAPSPSPGGAPSSGTANSSPSGSSRGRCPRIQSSTSASPRMRQRGSSGWGRDSSHCWENTTAQSRKRGNCASARGCFPPFTSSRTGADVGFVPMPREQNCAISMTITRSYGIG